MGDFNAKAEEQPQNTAVMGNHGLGKANDRGHKLIELCNEQKIVIISTVQEPQTPQIHLDVT